MCAAAMCVRSARAAEVYVCVRQQMRVWVTQNPHIHTYTHITSRQFSTFIPVVVVVVVVVVVLVVVVMVVVVVVVAVVVTVVLVVVAVVVVVVVRAESDIDPYDA